MLMKLALVGKVQRATFLCKHRYTGKLICAVPCDGEDDLCEDFEDENCKSSPFLTTILISFILLTGTIIVTEPIVRKQFRSIHIDKDFPLSGGDEGTNEFVELCLANVIFGKKQNQEIQKIVKENHCLDEYFKITNNLFLNGNYEIQKQIATTFYMTELKCHNGNIRDTAKCIRKNVGTNRRSEMLFRLTRPSFYQSQLYTNLKDIAVFQMVNNSLKAQIGFIFIKHIVHAVVKIILYYIDMVKDIIFIVIPANVFLTSIATFNSFGAQVFCLMWISILLPWMVNLSFLIAKNPFKRFKSKALRVGFSICSPFAPGMSILIVARYSIQQEVMVLKYLHHSTSMDMNTLCKTHEFFEQEIMKWSKIVAVLKLNEVTFENIIQSTLLILVFLLKQTKTATVVGLHELFVGGDFVYIVFSALWSILSMMFAHTKNNALIKNGFIPILGNLLFFIYNMLSITARICAIIVYLSTLFYKIKL